MSNIFKQGPNTAMWHKTGVRMIAIALKQSRALPFVITSQYCSWANCFGGPKFSERNLGGFQGKTPGNF